MIIFRAIFCQLAMLCLCLNVSGDELPKPQGKESTPEELNKHLLSNSIIQIYKADDIPLSEALALISKEVSKVSKRVGLEDVVFKVDPQKLGSQKITLIVKGVSPMTICKAIAEQAGVGLYFIDDKVIFGVGVEGCFQKK